MFEALNKELQLAVETNQIKQSFKSDFHATDKGRDLPVEIVTPDNRMVIQQSKPAQPLQPVQPPIMQIPQQSPLPHFDRFGGKAPFQHHVSDVNQYFGEDFKDEYDQDNMFYVQRRNKSQFKPGVGESPS